MSVQLVKPKKPIKCCVAGCEKEITTAELQQQDDGSIKVTMKCSDGHISYLVGLPEVSATQNGKLPLFVSYVKLVGVTFSNPDGTQRQSLLRYVKEGDEISVTLGESIEHDGVSYPISPLPKNLTDILEAGGLVKAMQKRNGLI